MPVINVLLLCSKSTLKCTAWDPALDPLDRSPLPASSGLSFVSRGHTAGERVWPLSLSQWSSVIRWTASELNISPRDNFLWVPRMSQVQDQPQRQFPVSSTNAPASFPAEAFPEGGFCPVGFPVWSATAPSTLWVFVCPPMGRNEGPIQVSHPFFYWTICLF